MAGPGVNIPDWAQLVLAMASRWRMGACGFTRGKSP